MRLRRSLTVAFVLAVLVGCRQPAPPPPPAADAAALRAAIEQRLAAMMVVYDRMDAAGVAATFTPDAVWILPDGSSLTGTAAITAGYERFFGSLDAFRTESVTVDRFLVVNDREVVTFSHAIAALTPKGKPNAERHINPFADHWQLGPDGVWRTAYEINADGRLGDPGAEKQ